MAVLASVAVQQRHQKGAAMSMTERELDLLVADLHDENIILKRQLAEVTRERDEMRDAYLEQVDLTVRMRQQPPKPESIYMTRFRNLIKAINGLKP